MSDDRSMKLLRDVFDAGAAVTRFAGKMSYDDYLENELVRSAVERQFMIVGEALSQLAKVDPELASRIPDIDRILLFATSSFTPTSTSTTMSSGRPCAMPSPS